MAHKDLYSVLGVTEKATADSIKKAYRKLAKEHHPDTHPGDKQAEERFKEVSQAYSVLSDPEKRQKYDHLRRHGFQEFQQGHNGSPAGAAGFDLNDIFGGLGRTPGRQSSAGRDFNLDSFFGFGGLTDLFGQFLDGQQGFRKSDDPRRLLDVQVTLEIPFKTAALGGKVAFTVPEKGNKRFSIQIPAATPSGRKFRLAGQGRSSRGTDASGDLIVAVRVRKHRFFEMNGLDIVCEIPLSRKKAREGTKVRVKTIHGKTVELRVPQNAEDGRRFRLKGLGIPRGAEQGDQYVTVKVQ